MYLSKVNLFMIEGSKEYSLCHMLPVGFALNNNKTPLRNEKITVQVPSDGRSEMD